MTLPIREPWFDAVEIEPGLHLITEPDVHALILANIWLVRGRDHDLLVDTGNGIAPLRPFVDTLRDDPAKPLVAVATHSHMDHAASLWEFDERVAHPADAGEIEHPVPLLHGSDVWPEVADAMAQEGFPVTELLVTSAPSHDWDPDSYVQSGAIPTRLVNEGDVIDIGRPRVPRPVAAGAHAGKHRLCGARPTARCSAATWSTRRTPSSIRRPRPTSRRTSRRCGASSTCRSASSMPDTTAAWTRSTMVQRCTTYLERRSRGSGG